MKTYADILELRQLKNTHQTSIGFRGQSYQRAGMTTNPFYRGQSLASLPEHGSVQVGEYYSNVTNLVPQSALFYKH